MTENHPNGGVGPYGEPTGLGAFASSGLVERVSDRARQTVEDAAQAISDQPFASLAFATLAGLALGLLLGTSRREVIYLRQ
jgi:hypothetical protein